MASSSASAVGDHITEPAVESLDHIASELEWHRLLYHGSVPTPRYQHAAVAVGRKMFVAGGTSPQGNLTDVQVFHAERLTWESLCCLPPLTDPKVTSGQQHDARSRSPTGHSLVIWENQLVLVGCLAKTGSKTVSVCSLNLSSRLWTTLSPKGSVPTARSGHTVIQMASKLVLFGGEDMKGHALNDIHILELKTLLWLPLETSGTKPPPRWDHAAASYCERYLWIFGGKSKAGYYNDTYCLDFKNMEWTKGKPSGRSPMARAGHSGTVAGNKWYIVGGESKSNEVPNTLAFNLDTHEWSEFANIRSGSPLAQEGISLVRIQSKGRNFAVAFGGLDSGLDRKLSNLVYVMLLPSTNDFMTETLSDASSPRSNSFDSVDSAQPAIRGFESPTSVRTSNASSGDSLSDATFDLGEAHLRACRERALAEELAKRQRLKERILATFPNGEEAKDETDHVSRKEAEDSGQIVQLSSPTTNSGDLSYKGDLALVAISQSLDPDPPNGMHESDGSGDLDERLSAALKLNEDLQNRLVQIHNAKVESEQALHASLIEKDDLEQKVFNLLQSKGEEDWKLEEARKKVVELEKKLNSPSLEEARKKVVELEKKLNSSSPIQEDTDSKSQSTSREEERTLKPNSLRTKLFEESAFNDDTDTTYETHRRLEEAETKLAALQNSYHLLESKLQTTTREKRELSEKAAIATQMLEEARSANKNLRAEKLRLEQALLAVKSTLADSHEDLQEKQIELAQATARNIELQVEMHELSQKISRF